MPNKLTLESSIDELDVSVRAYNVFKRMEINTIRDLVSYTEKDLLRQENFGRKSLWEVKCELAYNNLWLGMEQPKPDPIANLKKKVEELHQTLSTLSFRVSEQIVAHQKLVRLHNDVARAVIKLEDNKPGGVMPPQVGVSLRDQFAIAALTGLMSNQKTIYDAEKFARSIYDLADAMLEAREAK